MVNPQNSSVAILLLLPPPPLLVLLLLLLLHLRLSCLVIWNSKRSITPVLLSLCMPSRYMRYGGRATAPVSLKFGARWVRVVGSTPRPLYLSSLHQLYGPCRTLASFRINLQASLTLASFLQPLTSIFFRSFSTSSENLFRGFTTDLFPSGIFLKHYVARARNSNTIHRATSPQPSHYTDQAVTTSSVLLVTGEIPSPPRTFLNPDCQNMQLTPDGIELDLCSCGILRRVQW